MSPQDRSGFGVPPWGAWHEIYISSSTCKAQETPTQGHDIDMGTIQNTAALYLRKASLDDQVADLQLRVADLERRVPA